MASSKDKDLADVFTAVSDLHPDAKGAMRYLLQQRDGDRNVLGAVLGDAKVCAAITEREGKMHHPQGALVIDCNGMNASDLFFKTVSRGDGVYSVKGPLLQAWEDDRPIVLQNFPNLKAGTESVMQQAFQFFSGEVTSAKYVDPLGMVDAVALSGDDRKNGFRLRITGDASEFDENVSRSVQSRLNPYLLTQTAADSTAQPIMGIAPQELKKPK